MYPFIQADAFTDKPLGGNPCAILFDADNLDDKTMLSIAREMNLSETSFVTRSEQADFGARYFTPGGEIPLAGHPTIATTQALFDSDRLSLTGEWTEITIELKAGVIPVEISAKEGKIQLDRVPKIYRRTRSMAQPPRSGICGNRRQSRDIEAIRVGDQAMVVLRGEFSTSGW